MVAAKNSNGVGPRSGASSAVTVGTPTALASASAIPGDGKTIVTWTAPTSGNGSPPNGYVVTAFIGYFPVAQVTYASPARTETCAGLSDGTTYPFRDAANNFNGTGAPSPATGPVVVGAPTAPTNVTATAKTKRMISAASGRPTVRVLRIGKVEIHCCEKPEGG